MLNDLRIRQSKPRSRDYKLIDYDGLHLLVRPTGSKLWRLSYRFAGKQNRRLLEPAFETFGDRPIGEITAPELLHALRKFEQRERYESARRLRTVAGMVFRYAIATGLDYPRAVAGLVPKITSDKRLSRKEFVRAHPL
jgi:hypothetical protein